MKPDHASLWVRRWLRAAISLSGTWSGTEPISQRPSAIRPARWDQDPAWSCLPPARCETWSRLWHFSAAFEPVPLYRWSCSPILQTGKLRRAERKAPPGRPSPLFFCVRAISFSISEIFSRIPMVAAETGAPTDTAAAPGIPPSRRRQNCVRPEAHGEQRPRAPGAPGFRVRTDDVERSARHYWFRPLGRRGWEPAMGRGGARMGGVGAGPGWAGRAGPGRGHAVPSQG